MTMRWDERVQRGHHYAIVDEVDNVLIDEARTPLIISGPAQDEAEWYVRTAQIVKALRPEDYEINEKDRAVSLTELGEAHVEELMGVPLRDPDRPEDVTFDQARMLGYLEQAMRAQHLFRRNKDYLVQAGKVIIVDEFTGRLMPGRRWSDGLHQAVEAKEGVKVQSESVTYATITIQNYFRMYQKLAGMTGTAITEAEEFDKIYKLEVLAIPTNLEYLALRPDSDLIELEDRDENGYKYQFYTLKRDTEQKPVFWRRKDYPDVVYRSEDAKLRAIAREILRYHVLGRPMLVGTTSVELSERLSSRLRAEQLRRLAQAGLLRQVWMDQNQRVEDGRQISELQFLNDSLDKLDIGEMRRLARELDISFTPEDAENLERLIHILDLTPDHKPRLAADLAAGISHEVLNARKHTEESQIIAGAGAYGAVTIATNMAGRGVDIKLGGELAEEVVAAVARVLNRNGYKDPYDMSLDERRQALLSLPASAYGIYEAEVGFFMKYMEEMELVRALGGLHVIGSERHEARRIDNQLRGRSARQGDPGSSRFYLSMEDELMRLFGGQQADGLMQRLKIDDALPIEVGLVGRIVESSQTRVEGANFDVRKHLLEYDDVLNTQRASIYGQRNRIFMKDDLNEDVSEMLDAEVRLRVPEALKDEGGPWKLLAWLDQVQPPLQVEGALFPSFTLRLLVDELNRRLSPPVNSLDVRNALLDIARQSLETEKKHVFQAVEAILEQAEKHHQEQLNERLDAVDTFFEGLQVEDEEGSSRRPAELVAELSNAVRFPLKISPESQRALRDDPESVAEEVRHQVQEAMLGQAITRLIGAAERRLEEPIDLNVAQLLFKDWDDIYRLVMQATEAAFTNRIERYLDPGGQIVKDLDNALADSRKFGMSGSPSEQGLLQLLLLMPQGARAMFDKRTHRRVFMRTTRLTYTYYAAHFLEDRQPDEIAETVLEHLERAQEAICRAWGSSEFTRLGTLSLSGLDEKTRLAILEATSERAVQFLNQPLQSLPDDLRQPVVWELGRRALTEVYRQLLLSVITELWVDYLTQMESLRVSIGLEAYAQRDPLVQYKSKAYELFQTLVSNMRLGVVTRMFTFRPRDLGGLQSSPGREGTPEAELPELEEEISEETEQMEQVRESTPASGQSERQADGKNKKKRRRHR
jgi:preprotein translocase subunit SecA